MNFEQYATEMYPAAQAKIRAALAQNTPLAQFESVVLRLMHLLERGHIVIPESAIGETFRSLAAKACNESMGFIGCLRAGSFWAAQHHTRAMLELFASTHHLICKQASREKRFRRFTEYPELLLYQKHLRDRAEVDAGRLTEAQFEARRMVSIATVQHLEIKAPSWKELYGRDELVKVRHWHSPSTLEHLFVELDERTDREPTFPLYEHICHAIHVSPVGHRTVGSPGMSVLIRETAVVSIPCELRAI